MAKDTLKVSYKPGDIYGLTPQIKIANQKLKEYGFNIGDTLTIEYSKNQIVIRKDVTSY